MTVDTCRRAFEAPPTKMLQNVRTKFIYHSRSGLELWVQVLSIPYTLFFQKYIGFFLCQNVFIFFSNNDTFVLKNH